jgi:predicted transcriptional regulator
MSSTMTIRRDEALKSRLDELAESTHRSKSFLAAEAVRQFVEQNEWQVAQIKAAIGEADAGDFASDAEVKAVIHRWSRKPG